MQNRESAIIQGARDSSSSQAVAQMQNLLGMVLLLPLLTYASSSPFSSPTESDYTSTEPSNLQKTLKARIATLACSGVSMIACLVALCWFRRMEKQFRHRSVCRTVRNQPLIGRHRLIVLLFYGDLVRATWYFVFTSVSLGRGTVKSASAFCQSSGFLMQYGETTCGE
jgi:Na+/melibiose symporter-like transporter